MTATALEFGNLIVGGEPGENAPVMMGSIFCSGDPCTKDRLKGDFDRDTALRALESDRKMSERYGLPRILDVVGDTEEAIVRFIDFVAEEDDAPFLIDSMKPDVRVAGASYAIAQGLGTRAIYNSLDVHWTEAEINGIRETGIETGVILAFDAKYIKPNMRMELLQGREGTPGLLELGERAGFKHMLVDPGVLDLVSTGWTSKAITAIKEATGLPCGCAPSNALYSWKRKTELKTPVFEAAGAAILARTIYSGADFILYGPLANAGWAYPAVAVAASLLAYDGRLEKRRPRDPGHPLYRLFS